MANCVARQFQPITATMCKSKLEITVSCRNLADRCDFPKCDPMCSLCIYDKNSVSFSEIGRTEIILDSVDPDFSHKFTLDYYFQESQKLRFEMHHRFRENNFETQKEDVRSYVDSQYRCFDIVIANTNRATDVTKSHDVHFPGEKFKKRGFLGMMECTLGEIIRSRGKLECSLEEADKDAGKIIVKAEEVASCKEVATLQFRASKLEKRTLFGRLDPFLVLYSTDEDGGCTLIHKTEVIRNTSKPTWAPFSIPVKTLCSGDYNRIFKGECYHWEDEGNFALIGEFLTNLTDLSKQTGGKKRHEIINTYKKNTKKGYKNSGECILLSCKIETQPSFLDYIQGGTEIKFAVAIDFTDSNGDPYLPMSLHYNHPHQRSPYGKVIKAIGEIIQDYDTEKLFPVLGFGAMLPDGTVSHEFPCSFSPNKPYCQGIQGMLEAYDKCLRQVRLNTPTNLAPVINHIARFASSTREASHYFVLLIITKGSITDMPNTIKAIVDASYLPMSVIIVGVGNDKLEEMEVLNGNNQSLLSSEGKVAERDIVQVVPLRNFITRERLENPEDSLAKKVLSELPTQFLSYMQIHEFKPKPPKSDPKHPPNRPLHPIDFSQWSGEAPMQQQYRVESPPEQAAGGIPIQPQRSQKQCANVPKL